MFWLCSQGDQSLMGLNIKTIRKWEEKLQSGEYDKELKAIKELEDMKQNKPLNEQEFYQREIDLIKENL